jgi:hypothetical protein
MKSTRTIKTEVVSSKPDEIIFKLQQEYTPKPMPIAKKVNSLITLTLDEEGKVRYHKVCRTHMSSVDSLTNPNRTCGTRKTILMRAWGRS